MGKPGTPKKLTKKSSSPGFPRPRPLTLNGQAREARRPDTIIDNPMAVALLDSIDFDFTKFGLIRQDFAVRHLQLPPGRGPVFKTLPSTAHTGCIHSTGCSRR